MCLESIEVHPQHELCNLLINKAYIPRFFLAFRYSDNFDVDNQLFLPSNNIGGIHSLDRCYGIERPFEFIEKRVTRAILT